MNKNCKTCEKDFILKKKNQLFCSVKCIRNKTQFTKGVYVGFGFKKGHKSTLGKHWKVKDTSKMGHTAWNKGKKGTLKHTPETIELLRKLSTGRKLSKESRLKISESKKGSKNHSWKGGVTPLRVKIWHSPEYKLWRKSVFERDNYTCVWCGKIGDELNADHIKPFAYYPELRFAIDNGRTLCKPCHITTDTYGKWKK